MALPVKKLGLLTLCKNRHFRGVVMDSKLKTVSFAVGWFIWTEDNGETYGLPVVRESVISSKSTRPLRATLS